MPGGQAVPDIRKDWRQYTAYMTEVLAIVPVAAVAFLATNMDNFTLLVGLLARYRDNRLAVSAAYITSMILLCLVGFLIGEAAEQAPLEYIGFLGFVPIIIGISWLLKMARGSSMPARSQSEKRGTLAAFSLTLMAQIGNGTDTLLTFGVLFADSSSTADYLILITTIAMAVG